MQKKYFIIIAICLLSIFTACQKKIDITKIKGTWKNAEAGIVTIGDSTMTYPGDPRKHLYKIENDTTLFIYFDMDSVIRKAEIAIEKLDDDSLVVNNDYRTAYSRVK